ncbi:MAG: type II secretion system minor pseudopilin GspI [Cellvibrionaceae bacterium]
MITKNNAKKINKGFTLVEVVVAIAIIGFTVPAVMSLMINQTNYAGTIRDKTIANWIVENKMAELHHNNRNLQIIPRREARDTIEMAGAEWSFSMDIETAGDNDETIKYKMTISRETDQPLATLEVFLDAT